MAFSSDTRCLEANLGDVASVRKLLRSTSTKWPVTNVHIRNYGREERRKHAADIIENLVSNYPYYSFAAPTVKAMLQGRPRLFGLNERTNQSASIPRPLQQKAGKFPAHDYITQSKVCKGLIELIFQMPSVQCSTVVCESTLLIC